MNTPTFKEQFDKITMAYFKGKIEPLDSCACFVGNLLNGESNWIDCRMGLSLGENGFSVNDVEVEAIEVIRRESNGLYTPKEIVDMEFNFLRTWQRGMKSEDSLFRAMDSTLDMLRKIHESKGEVIESFEFKKRELVKI